MPLRTASAAVLIAAFLPRIQIARGARISTEDAAGHLRAPGPMSPANPRNSPSRISKLMSRNNFLVANPSTFSTTSSEVTSQGVGKVGLGGWLG